MDQKKVYLASDNCSPAHPLILQAIVEANSGFAPSYGTDPWTLQAQSLIQTILQTEAKVLMVPTGTGSNVFALKLACRTYESVICTDIAHIHVQETGAAEAVTGAKIWAVPGLQGKITPVAIWKKLRAERAFGKHSTLPKVVSITQPTEIGTVYTLDELKAISHLCKEEDLLLHIDGSRLYNAAHALGMALHEIVQAASPDILSLGGTKNGLMGAEALVIFNPLLQAGSDHLQKQTLQLLSKMRYLSAQFIPFFQNDLWRDLAGHANRKAKQLEKIVTETEELTLSCPVQTNQIFFTAPLKWIPLIQEHVACYLWNGDRNELRFITSWNTSEEDIARVKEVFDLAKRADERKSRPIQPVA